MKVLLGIRQAPNTDFLDNDVLRKRTIERYGSRFE
jgi:hypothetical protein